MTSSRRKRHMISLSTPEYSKLTVLKSRWENWMGKGISWGEFLMQLSAPAASGMALPQSLAATEQMAANLAPVMGFEAIAEQAPVVPTEIAASANPKFRPPTP